MDVGEVARIVQSIVPERKLEQVKGVFGESSLRTVRHLMAVCPPALISVACGMRSAGSCDVEAPEFQCTEPYYRVLCGELNVAYEVIRPSFNELIRESLRGLTQTGPSRHALGYLEKGPAEPRLGIRDRVLASFYWMTTNAHFQTKYVIRFAENDKVLSSLRKTFDEEASPNSSRTLGRLYGYPDCCIQNYVDRSHGGKKLRNDHSRFTWRQGVQRYVWHKPCKKDCEKSKAIALNLEKILSEVYGVPVGEPEV